MCLRSQRKHLKHIKFWRFLALNPLRLCVLRQPLAFKQRWGLGVGGRLQRWQRFVRRVVLCTGETMKYNCGSSVWQTVCKKLIRCQIKVVNNTLRWDCTALESYYSSNFFTFGFDKVAKTDFKLPQPGMHACIPIDQCSCLLGDIMLGCKKVSSLHSPPASFPVTACGSSPCCVNTVPHWNDWD